MALLILDFPFPFFLLLWDGKALEVQIKSLIHFFASVFLSVFAPRSTLSFLMEVEILILPHQAWNCNSAQRLTVAKC